MQRPWGLIEFLEGEGGIPEGVNHAKKANLYLYLAPLSMAQIVRKLSLHALQMEQK